MIPMSRVDLHVHSSASDGSLSPRELVKHAKEAGLEAIALTDHDTTSGLKEAAEAGKELGVDVIPGIEISIEMKGGTFHLLGFGIKENEELCTTLAKILKGRFSRNELILEKLGELGMPITKEELDAAVPGETPARPHIARIMVEKGYVKSFQDAFDHYLKKGAPAYIERYRMDDRQGIRLIRNAGGIPVMAHPFSTKLENGAFEEYIKTLIGYGLVGIEAYYTKHSKEQQDFYLEVAQKYGLLVTGGSDFHGISKPKISIGEGYGDMEIPYELYVGLKEAMKAE